MIQELPRDSDHIEPLTPYKVTDSNMYKTDGGEENEDNGHYWSRDRRFQAAISFLLLVGPAINMGQLRQ